MKNVPCPTSTESVNAAGCSKRVQTQKGSSGQDAGSSCPQDCSHKGPLASDVIIEIKVQTLTVANVYIFVMI